MEITTRFTDQLRNIKEHVHITQTTDEVIVGKYAMTLEQYLDALLKSLEEGKGKIETPILPLGTVKYSQFNNSYEKKIHEVFIDVPKKQWEITFYNETYKVGFPRMIFKYEVEEVKKQTYQVIGIYIVSVKGTKKINGNTELFRFPYSHIHPETTKVCMGMNQMPTMQCLSQLETLHYIFFSSPFGHDYYNQGVNTTSRKPLRNLLEEMKDKDFNEDYLSSMKKTFNEFFDFEIPKENENNVINN